MSRTAIDFAKLLRCVAICAVLTRVVWIAASSSSAAELPIRKLVLFTSGVSYCEHRGEVDGDASVDLHFDVEDVNDLLKSLVLQDLGGGEIATVTYQSKEPVTRRLSSFTIDLSQEPTLGQLLRQLRGERIKIDAAPPIEGVVVGVELRREPGSKEDAAPVEWLNIFTKRGLRSVAIGGLGDIELLNDELNDEFRQALAVLAEGQRHDKKTISLRFTGRGKRPVRVGYIRESPLWKTSYRLVLDKDDQALLQGWAIVENTSEADWNDVELSLASGNPISFIMNLYEPLYARRPEVALQLPGAITPPIYQADMFAQRRRNRADAKGQMHGFGGFAGMGGGMGGGGEFGVGPVNPVADLVLPKSDPLDPAQGVTAAAEGEEVGELFHYVIEAPVSLARQRSAMLPIVNSKVKAEKVSIYTATVNDKHPLAGLRLVNNTDLHLMQGPITVFDEGSYAGDARIADLPAGAERLVSYALDVETEIVREVEARPRQITAVKIANGELHASHRWERATLYKVKNSRSHDRRVLVEHPLADGWSLVAPAKPTETTRQEYRFDVVVAAGKSAVLEVVETSQEAETFAIGTFDFDLASYYLASDRVDQEIKDALLDLAQRRAALEAMHDQKSEFEDQLKEIHRTQERLRANMNALDRTSELYRSYVQKLGKQESEVERLEGEITKASREIHKQDTSLADTIQKLAIP